MYFAFRDPAEIAKETGVHLQVVYGWAARQKHKNKSWQQERLEQTEAAIKEAAERNKAAVHNVVRKGFALVQEAMEYAKVRRHGDVQKGKRKYPTVNEAMEIMRIIECAEKLLKSSQLEAEPVHVAGWQAPPLPPNHALTLEDFYRAMQSDYFLKLEQLQKEAHLDPSVVCKTERGQDEDSLGDPETWGAASRNGPVGSSDVGEARSSGADHPGAPERATDGGGPSFPVSPAPADIREGEDL